MLVAFLVLVGLSLGNCAEEKYNILFFSPVGWTSQGISFAPIAKELINRGHKLTYVSSVVVDVIKDLPNVTTVKSECNFESAFKKDRLTRSGFNSEDWTEVIQVFLSCPKHILNHPEKEKFLDRSHNFDLVICDEYGLRDICLFMAHYHNAFAIAYTGFQTTLAGPEMSNGMPPNPAIVSGLASGHANVYPFTFYERLVNTIDLFYWSALTPMFGNMLLDAVKEELPEESVPSWSDLQQSTKVSISLASPFLPEGQRTIAYNHIRTPLMNCGKPKPLSKELQAYLDQSHNGVVVMSFGSIYQTHEMEPEVLQEFLAGFSEMKQNFIIKWEIDEKPKNLPSNVKPLKWIPMQEVLAHKNVVAFVTHGGAASGQDAVCHAVPVVSHTNKVYDTLINLMYVGLHGIDK